MEGNMSTELRTRVLARLSVVLALVLVVPLVGWSQQGTSTETSANGQPGGTAAGTDNNQPTEESSSAQVYASSSDSTVGTQPEIRQLAGPAPLLGDLSPFRWGSLRMSALSFYHMYASFSPAGSSPGRSLSSGTLQSLFIYDKQFERSRFALQYQPRVAFINGEAGTDFLNQVMAFDTYYLLSPRWTMSIGNHFTYLQKQLFVPEAGLQVDSQSGATAQQDFFESGGSFLRNSASVRFLYQLGERSRIAIEPHYEFGRGKVGDQLAQGHSYGSAFMLELAVGPTKYVSVHYKVHQVIGTSDTARPVYQNVGVGYGQQFGPRWWFRSSVFVVRTVPVTSQPRQIGGYASIVRTFDRSSVSFTYNVDQGFHSYITDRYADRMDVGYRVELTRRITANFIAGYYRETGSAPRNEGTYAFSSLDYHLTPSLSMTVRYDFRNQHTTTNQLLAGRRNSLYAGIRWQPLTMP